MNNLLIISMIDSAAPNRGTRLYHVLSPGKLTLYRSKQAVELVIENKLQEGGQQQENVIRTIAFSPCGRYFAAGGDDKCVALLSTDGWSQIHAL